MVASCCIASPTQIDPSCFCMTHVTTRLPPKCPFLCGDLDSPSNIRFLGLAHASTAHNRTKTISLLQFLPEAAQNSQRIPPSFPRSEKSGSIPGFRGLWQSCRNVFGGVKPVLTCCIAALYFFISSSTSSSFSSILLCSSFFSRPRTEHFSSTFTNIRQ